jgi:hypothetical protein
MIKRLFHRVLRLFGLSPMSLVDPLVEKILRIELRNEELETLVLELTDENKSLWLMLDENKNSSKLDRQTVDDFIEEVRETLMDEMLKDFDPVGEA